MFRKSGERAFNRCDVKAIEFIDLGFLHQGTVSTNRGKYITPISGLNTVPVVRITDFANDTLQTSGNGAILHCPRTEDEKVQVTSASQNHNGRENALNSLRGLAGALICSNCRYSSMSPVEVATDRAETARAEADRLNAVLAKEQALLELAITSEQYRQLDRPTS